MPASTTQLPPKTGVVSALGGAADGPLGALCAQQSDGVRALAAAVAVAQRLADTAVGGAGAASLIISRAAIAEQSAEVLRLIAGPQGAPFPETPDVRLAATTAALMRDGVGMELAQIIYALGTCSSVEAFSDTLGLPSADRVHLAGVGSPWREDWVRELFHAFVELHDTLHAGGFKIPETAVSKLVLCRVCGAAWWRPESLKDVRVGKTDPVHNLCASRFELTGGLSDHGTLCS